MNAGWHRRTRAARSHATASWSGETGAEGARFLAVGVVNTVVTFVVFRGAYALLRGRPGAPALAQVAASTVGILCSFALNRGWTFKSGAARGPEFLRFVVEQLAVFALGAAVLELGIDVLRLRATPCWLLTTAGVAVVNFLALRYWVFRARQHGIPSSGVTAAGGCAQASGRPGHRPPV